jgi:hypothetical protein
VRPRTALADSPGSLAAPAQPASSTAPLPSNVQPLPFSDRKVSVKSSGNTQLMRLYPRVIPAVQPVRREKDFGDASPYEGFATCYDRLEGGGTRWSKWLPTRV